MRHYDFLNFESFTYLYQAIVGDLIDHPQYVIAPRGMKVREIVNVTVTVNPTDCAIDFSKTGAPERQEAYDRYRKAELEWYLSGNTLASSAPSKFWNQLAGQDGHITSNYGHMMLFDKIYPAEPTGTYEQGVDGAWETALERTVGTLLADNDSRQAIVFYGQPRHYYPQNKDQPCTLTGQFFLRDGKLNFTVMQRSCDIIRGYSYDCPWQCHFMSMVRDKLSQVGITVELGTFTHIIGSLHLYESNIELAKRIIARPEV